jgi:hypothetical protein
MDIDVTNVTVTSKLKLMLRKEKFASDVKSSDEESNREEKANRQIEK